MIQGAYPGVEEQYEVDVLVKEVEEKQIVLFNDDVNTFDHVIHCLMTICKHDPIQAEQCAIIVHFKGKCTVKSGEYEKLEPMCTALLDKGLTAEIQ
ncbi:MAG: ATP-dependent Clp protease adaptor ClpS [Flavobacteriales bacterium]|nr:ATP-dependent Clp protease adaptor ClpS [Flavobacteriales bacterium]